MNKKTHKKFTPTIALALLMVTLLSATACSKEVEPKEEVKASTEKVAETKVEEKEEVAEVVTPETVAEPTSEPTPEPVVYEGIDMESTLPGVEWVKTFEGIIEEPKMVVFNDTTNKKVIVEQGQEVDFAIDDMFLLYIPNSVHIVEEVKFDYDNFCSFDFSNYHALVFHELSSITEVGDSFVTTNTFKLDGVEKTFTATINVVE